MLLPNLNSVGSFLFRSQGMNSFLSRLRRPTRLKQKMCLPLSKSCDARRFLGASLCRREEITFIWTRQRTPQIAKKFVNISCKYTFRKSEKLLKLDMT